MPTEPLSNILNRSAAIEQAKDVIDLASPLLQELVNKGTHIYQACIDAAKDLKDTDFALISLYYHMLEMTDGIEVHISQGCAYPAISNLRSSFEALLAMRFLLKDPTEYEKHAFAWNVGFIHNEIRKNEKLDPTTDRGKKYYAVMKKQFNYNPEPSASGSAARKNQDLFDMLKQTNYQAAETAYQAALTYIDKKTGKPKKRYFTDWYRIYNGPTNLHELAIAVDKDGHYETLYGMWSEIAHAANITRAWTKVESGVAIDMRLRNPIHKQKLAEITVLATIFFAQEASYFVVKHFTPSEVTALEKWGQTEIAELFQNVKTLAETL